MMTNETDIPEALLKALPGLNEKFVVDFANSIEVSDDHLRIASSRTGFFNRMYDSFTGQRQRGDLELQRNAAAGMHASLQWLTELTDAHAQSLAALTCVQNRVTQMRRDLNQVVNFSADVREDLRKLEHEIAGRLESFGKELGRVDKEQRANAHLSRVMDKWEAGEYAQFSLLQQIFVALDDLYCGHFGDCFRDEVFPSSSRDRLRSDLRYKCINRLNAEIRRANASTRLSVETWRTSPRSPSRDRAMALAWLGDWTTPDQPFSYLASQPSDDLPLEMPRIFDAERAADAMSGEFFEERAA